MQEDSFALLFPTATALEMGTSMVFTPCLLLQRDASSKLWRYQVLVSSGGDCDVFLGLHSLQQDYIAEVTDQDPPD